MTLALRFGVFMVAVMGLTPACWVIATQMPTFGGHPLPYGDLINQIAPVERHVTNMVSAVNFDYRGFDTLGEEFMLACAVTGIVVLLRGNRGEQLDAALGVVAGRAMLPRSEATVLITRLAGPLVVLFGVYVALHAMTTPGGGFQGGVIVASGLLLLFLGEGYAGWRSAMSSPVCDACEGLGATLYAICGCASLGFGLPFLSNWLPVGTLKDVFAGGLMQWENVGVTFAVIGGFMALFIEFLEETRVVRPQDKP
jgi:multicomponent Na+:H+ antiporter subunit B